MTTDEPLSQHQREARFMLRALYGWLAFCGALAVYIIVRAAA